MKNGHLEDRDEEKMTRIGYEDSIWMKLTQDCVQWRALV
jgi:hypothetical protein